MRVVVLGATGEMGGLVVDLLGARGHAVVPASRASGVDVLAPGLADLLRGADTVVDCLNVETLSRREAVSFFGGTAGAVTTAARDAGVPHLVLTSIVGMTDPAVSRSTGYYAGKAAQEETYAAAAVPVSVVRSTAWFTLAETFLRQVRIGPVAVVPRMRLRPVHPAAVADLLVEVVESGPSTGPAGTDGPAVHEVAGPDTTDSATMARAVATRDGEGVRVLSFPAPFRGMRHGLLPGPTARRDERGFADWVSRRSG